jgi:hypothetical protein
MCCLAVRTSCAIVPDTIKLLVNSTYGGTSKILFPVIYEVPLYARKHSWSHLHPYKCLWHSCSYSCFSLITPFIVIAHIFLKCLNLELCIILNLSVFWQRFSNHYNLARFLGVIISKTVLQSAVLCFLCAEIFYIFSSYLHTFWWWSNYFVLFEILSAILTSVLFSSFKSNSSCNASIVSFIFHQSDP